jgi:hypothetical protein
MKICNSLFATVTEFGPKAKALKSTEMLNGFKVNYFCCSQKNCMYQSQVFYPLTIESKSIPTTIGSSKPYQLVDSFTGPVVSQVKSNHFCTLKLSWHHFLQEKSKHGLHPILKEAVDREGNMDHYKLPRQDEMLRRTWEQYAENVDTLIPEGCLDKDALTLFLTR